MPREEISNHPEEEQWFANIKALADQQIITGRIGLKRIEADVRFVFDLNLEANPSSSKAMKSLEMIREVAGFCFRARKASFDLFHQLMQLKPLKFLYAPLEVGMQRLVFRPAHTLLSHMPDRLLSFMVTAYLA